MSATSTKNGSWGRILDESCGLARKFALGRYEHQKEENEQGHKRERNDREMEHERFD